MRRVLTLLLALASVTGCAAGQTAQQDTGLHSLRSDPGPGESGIPGFARPPGLTVFASNLDGERWSFNADAGLTFEEVDSAVDQLYPLGKDFGAWKWCVESSSAALYSEQRIRRYAQPGSGMVEVEVRLLGHQTPVSVSFTRRKTGDCRTDPHMAP